jgi:hypothetical protein
LEVQATGAAIFCHLALRRMIFCFLSSCLALQLYGWIYVSLYLFLCLYICRHFVKLVRHVHRGAISLHDVICHTFYDLLVPDSVPMCTICFFSKPHCLEWDSVLIYCILRAFYSVMTKHTTSLMFERKIVSLFSDCFLLWWANQNKTASGQIVFKWKKIGMVVVLGLLC